MLSVKLTKVESNHNNLRTNEIVGRAPKIPELGEYFSLFAPPLVQPASLRAITTTEIQAVDFDEGTRTFTFKTLNSTYKLEVLGDTSLEEIFSYRTWRADA